MGFITKERNSIAQISVTFPSTAYEVDLTGTGNEDLDPANGGYVKALNGYSEVKCRGDVFEVLSDGSVKVHADGLVSIGGYASLSHSVSNSMVGVSFYIHRGGYDVISPRSAFSRFPTAGSVRELNGVGMFDAVKGDILSPAFASNNSGKISIRSSSLIIRYEE